MKTLGLAIITKNEERLIKKCIQSVPFATQIVIVDSHSTDKTVEIAKSCGAEVITRSWEGYAKQKQYAIEQLKTDWVLALDGDEYLSKELQDEIIEIIKSETQTKGFYLKREHVFLKKLLKHGKGVDFQLRLFRRESGHYDDRVIHEKVIINGPCEKSKMAMIHESSLSLNDEMEKITRDTELERVYHKGGKIGVSEIIGKPLKYFLTMFFFKATWKDGLPGFIFLTMTSFKYFLLYSKLYEMNLNSNKRSSDELSSM